MKMRSWLLANYRYHWVPALVLLAISALCCTLFAGSLGVGDSVRLSLENFAQSRLGKTEAIVSMAGDTMSIDLAEALGTAGIEAAALLEIRPHGLSSTAGSATKDVQLYGVDKRLKVIFPSLDWDFSEAQTMIINQTLANRLNVQLGESVLVTLPLINALAADSPFQSQKPKLVTASFKIKAIIADSGPGAFSRRIAQELPAIAYCDLKELATLSGLADQCNQILLATAPSPDFLSTVLPSLMGAKDLGIEFVKASNSPEAPLVAHSRSLFFRPALAQAFETAFPRATPLFAYFLTAVKSSKASVPFVFVHSALPPLTDVLNTEHSAVLTSPLAQELGLAPGDRFVIHYFSPSPGATLETASTELSLSATRSQAELAIYGPLLPNFPGLSAKASCSQWDPSLPIDLSQVRPADEAYWSQYGPSPRLIIPYDLAKNLWSKGTGHTTGYLLPAKSAIADLEAALQATIDVAALGFQVDPIRRQAVDAARNGVDFAGLFLGLSFFLVLSVLIILRQVYRVYLDRRSSETSTLSALGFSPQRLRAMLFIEALLPMVLGLVPGLAAAHLFNSFITASLGSTWNNAVGTSILLAHSTAPSLALGATASLLATMVTLGITLARQNYGSKPRKVRRRKSEVSLSTWIIASTIGLVGAIMPLFPQLFGSDTSMQGYLFFCSGACILASLCWLFRLCLSLPPRSNRLFKSSAWIIDRLRQRAGRSSGTVTLFAMALFLIITLAVFQIPDSPTPNGSAGYSYWAELGKIPRRDLEEFLPPHLNFSRRPGDPADCRNLNRVDQPALLGIDPMVMDRAFSVSQVDATLAVQKPAEAAPWDLLNTTLTDGSIPAFADATVITWILKKQLGDYLSITNDQGQVIRLRLVGALANSVFQGHVIISQKAMDAHFAASATERVLLIKDTQPDATKTDWYRQLRPLGFKGSSTQERMRAFNAIENSYLQIFGFLSFLALVLGTLGLALSTLHDAHQDQHEWAILGALGFSKRRIILLHSLEKISLIALAAIIACISAFFALLGPLGIALYPSQALVPIAITLGVASLSIMVVSLIIAQRLDRGGHILNET